MNAPHQALGADDEGPPNMARPTIKRTPRQSAMAPHTGPQEAITTLNPADDARATARPPGVRDTRAWMYRGRNGRAS